MIEIKITYAEAETIKEILNANYDEGIRRETTNKFYKNGRINNILKKLDDKMITIGDLDQVQ